MPGKVVVIGGGASGLVAAGVAAERGLDVELVEKNRILGRKLRISGKGRCNITNATDIDGLIRNIPGNGNFLYSAFSRFSSSDIIDFFNRLGVRTKVERGGRVFPVSDNAHDVAAALKTFVRRSGVKITTGVSAIGISAFNGRVAAVRLSNGRDIDCFAVIVATGGLSYPLTGSTGDGYSMAKELGHTVTELCPSLVPLETIEKWPAELQGLSLKNISIKVIDRTGAKVYEDFGEMLFTHFGVSGPVILSASRHMMDSGYGNTKLIIDLKPALDEVKLDNRIRRDFEKYSNRQFKNSLGELLPSKLIPVILRLSGIDPEKPVNQITKDERRRLLRLLKGLGLNIKGARPIEEAIVTAGGICVDEINPRTMESKLIKGLFFSGEIIDVDGYTGGFNLTIAFSTGYAAGSSCCI